MPWRRRFWATLALLFAAFAGLLLWQHLRPWWIGVGPDEPLIPVPIGDKHGYVTMRGVLAIPPRWDQAGAFGAGGVAIVAINGDDGVIDRRGREVVPCGRWQYLRLWDDAGAPIAVSRDDPKSRYWFGGLLHPDGTPCVAPVWRVPNRLICLFPFNAAGLTRVADPATGKVGAVDRRGQLAIPCAYDALYMGGQKGVLVAAEQSGKFGYLDPKGNAVAPFVYDAASDVFDDRGWAIVARGGKKGWIDRTGKLVLPPRWDDVQEFDPHGWARVKVGERLGWIDRAGRPILPPKWEDAGDFDAEGWARTKLDGQWGWIDRQGQTMLPHRYQDAKDFDDDTDEYDARGVARVTFDQDRAGWIDRQGWDAGSQQLVVDAAGWRQPFAVDAADWRVYPLHVGKVLADRAGRAVTKPWSTIHAVAKSYVARDWVHPWLKSPALAAFAKRLGIEPLPGLAVVYDARLRIVWRSDLHALRPALLPAAAGCFGMALLCVWRMRVAKRKAAAP